MEKPSNYFIHQPKQERSHARIEKILDAVEELSEKSPTTKIDIKSIAKKSFISIGAIYHHFPSVNSIFASLLLRKVKLRIEGLAALIDGLGPNVTLEEFTDQLINQAFYEWGQN